MANYLMPWAGDTNLSNSHSHFCRFNARAWRS